MRESIGFTVTINIIMIFIFVTLACAVGIVSYSKAFRANSKIVNALEKYEGYNLLSLKEINQQLSTLGYSTKSNKKCADSKNGGVLVQLNTTDEVYNYCLYYTHPDGNENHYSYGVVTYIELDFSFFGMRFQVPIYAKTRRTYYFSKGWY